jgi:putative membrane protein
VTGALETQSARTALAWQRTGLSLLLVAGLLGRGAAVHGRLVLVVPTAVVALAGLAVLGVLGPRRQRDGDAAARTGGDARAPRAATVATGLVVLTALCALTAELVLRS